MGMLTEKDIEWIKSNRTDLLASRTEPVTLFIRRKTGEDPYTGEPTYENTEETADAVWTENASELMLEKGIEVKTGDAQVSLKPNVGVYDVNKVRRNGIDYKLAHIDEKGLGGLNRYECVARRVT